MDSLLTNVYVGRLGLEKRLCTMNWEIAPNKGDIIFYGDEFYKVMYCLLDVDNDKYNVFVRLATEEDY